MKTIKTDNLNDVLVSAMRYALGRSTYIVPSIADTLIQNWEEICENDQKTIVAGIQRAIDTGQAGMQMDVEQWQRVIDHAQEAV